jgi:GYF domain 2
LLSLRDTSSAERKVRGRFIVLAPNDAVWFIARDRKHAGPFTADEFARFEVEGHLRPSDRVWKTGMDAWMAYGDYEARRAAMNVPTPNPAGPPKAEQGNVSSASWSGRGLGGLTNTLAGAFRSVSARLARERDPSASPGAANHPPLHAPEGADGRAPRTPANPHSASTRSPLAGAPEPNVQRGAGAPISERPAPGGVTEHSGKPRHEAVSDAAFADAAEAARRSRSTPRLASEVRAAIDIGLDLTTFRTWVADGRLPRALPDCGKYDMKAIHLALDRMSGIAPGEGGSSDWSNWLTRPKG